MFSHSGFLGACDCYQFIASQLYIHPAVPALRYWHGVFESTSPYSGLRLGPISRERWRASFPSSNAAVVLFSVAPSAQHSQQCLGRACRSLLNSQLWPCPWPGSHFTVPHTLMQILQAGHAEPASTAVLFPDLPLHSHLLALHLLGFLQLRAPAEPAFSPTWHVQWRGVLQCPPAE